MSDHIRNSQLGEARNPTRLQLLGNPLDLIHEDHLYEREICATLDHLAETAQPNPGEVLLARAYLREELPLHLEDEEQDLFPLLLRRCEPDDEIGKIIERLTAEHARTRADAPGVIEALSTLDRVGARIAPPLSERLTGFAAHARRHLILENALVLPFARLRLKPADLEQIRLRMIRRRGLDRVMDPGHDAPSS
ncbi:MAG: hemerythrin domain-containing protein [Paracoccaceae bacterium]